MILSNLFAISLCISITHAQLSFTPESTWGPAFASIEGKALYIQGGKLTQYFNFVPTQQAFFIDLSKPWDISSPLYTKMRNGVAGFQHPNALTNDNTNWFILTNQTIFTYNLASESVTDQVSVLDAVSLEGFGGVINPTGNLFRAPRSPSFDLLAGYRFYAIAKSNSANAAFVFGGFREVPTGLSSALLRYNFQASTWAPVYAAGPSERDSPCLVPAYNGTKLVLFGGIQSGLQPLSDIYIYDLATNSWRVGPSGTITRARASPACGVSGDYFITFGGYGNKRSRFPPSELISVFNLKTNTWVTQYQPPSYATPSSSASGPAGLIAGGVVGGVAVIAVVVFFLYRRRRSKKDASQPSSQSEYPPITETEGSSANVYHAKPLEEENYPLTVQLRNVGNIQALHMHHNQSQLNERMLDKKYPSKTDAPNGTLREPQYIDPASFGGYHRHPSTFVGPPSIARNPQTPPRHVV
ncbi:kelch domain-containing protein 3 [Podila verticillata]|nr:kelch domain-containing protein 3 [Podila verticillata]